MRALGGDTVIRHPALSSQLLTILQEILCVPDYFSDPLEQIGIDDGVVSIGLGCYCIVDVRNERTYSYNPFSNELTLITIGPREN